MPAAAFTLLSGEDVLTTYTFHRHRLRHSFCSVCGVQPFAEGERDGVTMRAVNLCRVSEVDRDRLEICKVDGARF